MFSQPQQNAQPFPSTNPPSPVPPGPVPAPAPRQAGDIPDPPLNSAGSSGNKGGTVFEVVTDRIIALLEQGTAPWRADWVRAATQPISLSTGKPYRGINHFLLTLPPRSAEAALVSSTIKQFQAAQADRWNAVHGYRERDVLAGPVRVVQSTQLVADGLKKVSWSLWARPALIFLPLHDPD